MSPSNVPTQKTLDLLAVDLLPECPGCHELCPGGATVCAECGTHLFVRTTTAGPRAHHADGSEAQQKEDSVMAATGCTCGGRGLCTQCVLAEYEGDTLPQRMMAEALDATFAALEAPGKRSNVVELHGHSKKVS